MRFLPLTFPKEPDKGRHIALAGASGVSLRYEVSKIMTGDWQLTIWPTADDRRYERAYQFTSERKAKDYARADFRRRQLVRLAA